MGLIANTLGLFVIYLVGRTLVVTTELHLPALYVVIGNLYLENGASALKMHAAIYVKL